MVVGFLITARLKSKRLPKKVLLDLAGRPAICHMLDRIRRAKRVNKIVICTSTNPQDDPLAQIAVQEGVSCYRGSEDDVLARLYGAAVKHGVDYVVNITADCPLVDPAHIDRIVKAYESTNADLISTSQLPAGQRPYGIKVDALGRVYEIKAESDTEVWEEYFTKSGLFYTLDLEVEPEYRHPQLKTSLDYPDDYEFLKRLFNELYVHGKVFSLKDVLLLVRQHPEILSINAHCKAWGIKHISMTAAPMKLKTERAAENGK